MANGDTIDPGIDPFSQEPVSKRPPPPGKPPTDNDQDVLDRQQARAQQQRLMSLLEKTMSSEQDIFTAREKEMAPQRRDLASSLQRQSEISQGATSAYLKSQKDIPEFKQPDIRGDAFQWMAIASSFGAIAGSLSRYHTTTALNAFGGAMKGWAEGKTQVFEQNYQEWKANAERAHEYNDRATREYAAIMKNANLDVDTRANLMRMTAEKYQDQLMATAAQERNIVQMGNILNTQQRIGDNFYAQMLKLDEKKKEVDQKTEVELAKAGLVKKEDGSIGIDDSPGSKMYQSAQQVSRYERPPPSTVGGRNMGMVNEFMALVGKISQEETGQPYDASKWTGKQAYQRTAGTYGARVETATNEVGMFIPQALQASSAEPRGKWVSVNKLVQDYQAGKSDPRYYDFAFANYSLLNAYTRAINPTGVPRIQDKEHAATLLSTVTDEASYKRVLLRMAKEVRASHAAVAMTRGDPDASANASENILRMTDAQLEQFIATNGAQVTTPSAARLTNFISSGGGVPAGTAPIHGPGTEPDSAAGADPFAGFEIVK